MTPPVRLAINGYGRIGRSFLRAIHERGLAGTWQVVAINEPADLDSIVYLTRYDSTHGRFRADVRADGSTLCIDDARVAITHEPNPEAVPWHDMALDVVVECSGRFSRRNEIERFLRGGTPRVLLSQPGASADDVDATVVYGINHASLDADARIVSNASCTTNAVVPLLTMLDEHFGLDHVLLTTVHSVMNDQPLIDGYHHPDLRRTRSAMQSIIPVSTGLARGVERLLPQLEGRIEARAMRVPTLNVSAIELVAGLGSISDAATINATLSAAAARFDGLVGMTHDAHASIDFIHDPRSVIIDASQTRVVGGRLASLLLWFDNEWGYASRLVDTLTHWQRQWRPAASNTFQPSRSHQA